MQKWHSKRDPGRKNPYKTKGVTCKDVAIAPAPPTMAIDSARRSCKERGGADPLTTAGATPRPQHTETDLGHTYSEPDQPSEFRARRRRARRKVFDFGVPKRVKNSLSLRLGRTHTHRTHIYYIPQTGWTLPSRKNCTTHAREPDLLRALGVRYEPKPARKPIPNGSGCEKKNPNQVRVGVPGGTGGIVKIRV